MSDTGGVLVLTPPCTCLLDTLVVPRCSETLLKHVAQTRCSTMSPDTAHTTIMLSMKPATMHPQTQQSRLLQA